MGLDQRYINNFSREIWQKHTFDKIKQKLFSAKNNRFVRYDNYARSHLVLIYGKSQVGKTTLILNLIGIKDEYFDEVYKVLRAGARRGNSSTSTAIVYSQSPENKYGYAVSSLNEVDDKDIYYYNEKEISKKLNDARNKLEKGEQNLNDVIYIYIPKDYFVPDAADRNISIIDVPGVESRNRIEAIYAQNLLTKYLPVASVCIIACRSNEIQSLESLVLPGNLCWKNMGYKFLVVITNSYSDGSIKNYFRKERKNRDSDFYHYVAEQYSKEMRHILGNDYDIKIFPVDVGDSFGKLRKEELKNEKDKEEVLSVRNKFLSEIRDFIVQNEYGGRLQLALKDLKIIIDTCKKENLSEIEKEILSRKKKKDCKKSKIESLEKKDIFLETYEEELNQEREFLNNKKGDILAYCNEVIIDLDDDVLNYIKDNSFYKYDNTGAFLKDKKKEVFAYIYGSVYDFLYNLLKNINYELEQLKIPMDIYKEMNIYENFLSEQSYNLYPQKQSLFSKRKKVYFSEIKEICEKIQDFINSRIKECIFGEREELDKMIERKEYEIRNIKKFVKKQGQKKTKLSNEINEIDKEICDLEKEKEGVEKAIKQDEETLNMYLKFAQESYLEQRNQIVNEMNTCHCSDKKLLLLMFLGVLDKDYNAVMGDIR